jgi:hypothetical protein
VLLRCLKVTVKSRLLHVILWVLYRCAGLKLFLFRLLDVLDCAAAEGEVRTHNSRSMLCVWPLQTS